MNETNAAACRGKRDGVRLGHFHLIATVVFAVLTLVLLLSIILTSQRYSRMEEATERYITAQQAAANMQAASDFLTAQARTFVVTGDPVHAQQFFEEVNVTKRRDRALDEINDIIDSDTYAYLQTALNVSNELLQIECHAMMLAAESYGYDLSDYPEEMRDTAFLSDASLALFPEEQREKALLMLFDETYQSMKDEIQKNVSLSVEVLIDETREQQKESASQLLHQIRREAILIVVMLLMAVLLVLSTTFLVSKPLKTYIERIQRDEKLQEIGASELRFLAEAYNHVREQNLAHREQLRYDATHDPLTGVFNRSVFEKLRARCDERENALLIFDIDKFKQINDQNGHDVGDRALRCVAALLQQSFRAEDYVCRIGGDEFVVIMVRVTSALKEFVAGKITRINDILREPKDGLPSISLSVGVAFADRENPSGDIFKDADTALYRTKSRCFGGYEFY